MAIFNWRSIYSVNNDVIDNHHKKIIELFNKLYESIDQPNTETYEETLNELTSYAQYHFATEEQYMADINFVNADEHIHEHRVFSEKLQDLKNVKTDVSEDKYRELIYYLGYWVLNHETEKDIELVKSLSEKK